MVLQIKKILEALKLIIGLIDALYMAIRSVDVEWLIWNWLASRFTN